MRAWIPAALLASALSLAAQAQGPAPHPDPHCLSQNPRKLGLTDDQVARIQDIVRTQPESAARRAAILKVLTRMQWQLYWSRAGIAAC